ncbi:uncharacterized protein SRS1_14719 [Sporisorium reilianum f. sp. reilianum]|uniref:Uncharacterized protein n=1 Tax=Sporisorium reilianum f. sp. reilianum TaxID=72559 RepID=A0A2N8UGG5_9BASI|nr:uncharacterized protein SRS1_14719 [Sporisorium reilianum f. sp. reilianum]
MTRAEAAPQSTPEPHARHPTTHGRTSGPAKPSTHTPSGASALATEISATLDAQHDLAAARAAGDPIPASNAAALGFGQPNGAQQGASTPGAERRDEMQRARTAEFAKRQPDLREIAATSAGSASRVAAGERQRSGRKGVEELLDTVGRSVGTESGTGAAKGGEIEVTRDAPTARTA